MLRETLTDFITKYINGRKTAKLESFDKDAEKKLAAMAQEDEAAKARVDFNEKRAELESQYQIAEWLTNAASRARQISLVTHTLKFTHSDARGSSIFSAPSAPQETMCLSSATLNNRALDAVGNAAALDVAKLLQTEVEGDSLIASLHRGDVSALEPFTNDRQLLDSWVNSFKQVLIDREPASHKLAKQLYFPIGESQYHLLSPLFSSSLYHALHQRITAARFSEEAKAARSAMRAGRWHSDPVIFYPATAVIGVGGTKPQNISYLNSVHGGKVWLLSCASPSWKSISTPPLRHKTIFNFNIEFARQARPVIARLKRFLYSVKSLENTAEIRQQRLVFTDEIIDILFNYVLGIQNQTENRCWSTQENCQLKRAQQLWLDPYRSLTDKDFRFEREGGDWKKEVARDFGHWMISQIQDEHLRLGAVERREFSTAPLFKQRLRELEQDLQEELS
ncbi:type I-F CRISPR-associated protein Csy1 [Erwinia sorbitola]|uniref:Type I-F CRISPR-associated protein Csy1 n=1 Tax=Erwinia sorbitola TaxID=2681984 RepID=A0ABW9RBB4_9GAMM|nr:type I-F CRISPR-associated protein Csy1 [Erwinia sorbitola]MTD27337.1 type I-F CRISPR-associated protein Csy1 [Erwinia sorbitola]